MTTKSLNPFISDRQQAPTSTTALATTDSNKGVAEIQASMMIAKSFPRDQIAAMDRILNACTRINLANAAVYQYARGGTDITGPSIRLAETIAQNWGNISFGIRELESSNGESTVQAYCRDIETNTYREMTFQVPHIRYSKSKGNTKLTDPRDIYELIANQGARRLRACILAIIPGDVTEAALEQCELTMRAKADTSKEAVQKMVEAFSAMGVSKEQLEARIQRRMDAIQPAQIVGLRKVYASIKDGMSKPDEWFDPIKQPTTDVNALLSGKNNVPDEDVPDFTYDQAQDEQPVFDQSVIDQIESTESKARLSQIYASLSKDQKKLYKGIIQQKQDAINDFKNNTIPENTEENG